MTKKQPVLIDMDGVIVDFVDSYYRVAKNEYPDLYSVLPTDRDEIRTFYIEDSIPFVSDRIKSMARSLVDSSPDLFSADFMTPIPGAISCIMALSRMYDVFFVTTPHLKNRHCMDQKIQTIEKYFPGMGKNVVLSQDKTLIDGIVLIDDKPVPNGKFVPTWEHVVFSQPYNQDVRDKYRLNDWSHNSLRKLCKYIDNLYEEKASVK